MHTVSRRLEACLLLLLAAPVARATTLNVPSAQYPTIQTGIDAAAPGDTVLVADGTYTGPGNRDLDFGGKAITVASVHGPDSAIIDCQASRSSLHAGVTFQSGETAAATLSGLTIKNALPAVDEYGTPQGGAVSIVNSSPTITNCTLIANQCNGIDVSQGDPAITNCLFIANGHYYQGINIDGVGIEAINSSLTIANCTFLDGGDGVSVDFDGSPTISGCVFMNNTGGLKTGNNATVTDCTFLGNSSDSIFCYGPNSGINSTPTFTNCTMTGSYEGIDVALYGSPTFTNCTITDNQSGISVIDGRATLVNCILYDSTTSGHSEVFVENNSLSSAAFSHCDVQGGYAGTANINADPLFVRPPTPQGRPADPGDLHLQPGSPCLGAGTPTGAPATDLDGNPRPNPPSIGAYDVPRPLVARFDFNHDRHPDLLWHNTQTGQTLVWNMNDTAVLAYDSPFATVSNTDWMPAAVTDLYSDGYADLLWENTRTGQVLFWYMGGPTGTHVFTYGSPFAAMPDTHWRVASMADFNADGNPDILWENNSTGQLLIWYMNGASVATYGQPFATVPTWQVAGTADFNGDGHPDLLWRNLNTGQMLVWDMGGANGTQVLSYGSIFAQVADSTWQIVGTGDTNGDGHPDITWQNSSTGQILRWLMGGTNGADGTQVQQYGAPFATVPDTHWQIVGGR